MGPLAPADRPAASEPGGHLVNKMLVAKETEKPHHRPWLQLSGSLLLERFRLSYSAPILLFITVKGKVRGESELLQNEKGRLWSKTAGLMPGLSGVQMRI